MSTRTLLAHPSARRYLAGQALSLLGDSAMWMACGIWVKTLTGSNAAAGLTFFFFTAPALLAPLAGLLVDRVRRRRLLLIANLAGAAVVSPLLLVNGADEVWLIYLVMALYGLLNILIAPAQSALLVSLLPAELLASANAVLRTIQESLRILAPLAGAGLFALVGGRAVVVLDMVTFLAAAGFILSLRGPDLVPARPDSDGSERSVPARIRAFAREAAAGGRFIVGDVVLRRVTFALALGTLVIGFGESAIFAVVSEGLRRPPEFIGVVQMVQGIGAIIGGLTAARAIAAVGEVRVAVAGMVVFAAGPALQALGVLPPVLLGKLLSGIGLPWLVIAILTLLQRLAPHHLQGRVFAALEVATSVPQALSIALGAGLIVIIDYRVVLVVEAAVLVVAAVLMLRVRPPRQPVVADPAGQPTPVGSAVSEAPPES